MFQGWMLRIHSKKVFSQLLGTNTVRPVSTALIGSCASVLASQYHWSESQGSITAPVAVRHHVDVVLDLLDEAKSLHVGGHPLARHGAIETTIGLGHVLVQM